MIVNDAKAWKEGGHIIRGDDEGGYIFRYFNLLAIWNSQHTRELWPPALNAHKSSI